MSSPSPFDHRPDPELGRELRAMLSADDKARFVRRVIAAAESVFGEVRRPAEWWEVLTAWARPGLAAAVVLIAIAGFWLGTLAGGRNGTATLGDPLRADNGRLEVPVLLADQRAPDLDVVLAAELENQ